jgi:peptidoglycan/xylan/chitin deacetylase (PgdA/CDA1 family)
VPPDVFEEQVRYLSSGYDVISVNDILETYRSKVSLPPRPILITFDDGYSDFADYAWPILKSYHLPVTLFVPTSFPNHPERCFWWDWLYTAIRTTPIQSSLKTPLGTLSISTSEQREAAFSQLREYVKILPHAEGMEWINKFCYDLGIEKPENHVLSWETLRTLAFEGVCIGAHTQNHPMLNKISVDECQAEVSGSLHDLDTEIGSVLPIFAYPSGGFNDQVVSVLDSMGILLAFTTQAGINELSSLDRLRIRRININRGSTINIFKSRMLLSRL